MENRSSPNIKTYEDLIADTENTWDFDENLEELLFDCDNMLEEAVGKSYTVPIKKGDIIMANNGVSDREQGLNILSPHRIFIIEDATGEIGNRVFRGYLMSSQVRKANYYNKGFPNNIYIKDYSTILDRGPKREAEVFINLSDCYTIEEAKMDRESSGLWKGHAKPEFISFIDKAVADIASGKSVKDTYWLADK
jgi:hypothetical protein